MTYRPSTLAVAALALAAVAAPAAEAQIFTPGYASPRSVGDLGLYLSDGPGGPLGGDFAVEGIFRQDVGGYDVGLRAAVADADTTGTRALLGADLRSPFTIEGVPVEFAFTSGIQANLGEGGSELGSTAGLTAGYTFVPGTISFTPYLNPRVAFIGGSGRDDLDIEVLADLGVDVFFSQGVAFRLGFGLGEPVAHWGLGVSWNY
ncbi:MAG: hypothetical protein ACREKN_02945 [Longimicrobiaceae bacterium]